ncbi:MAG: hypothetical protein V4615_12225 [Bacteroidota bacterium]
MIKALLDKVLITLEIDDKTSILILLTRNGEISRKGNGNLKDTHLPLMQGISHDGHFEALLMTISEDIFNYTGVIKQPERLGKECTLSIIFQGKIDVDYSFRVLYGEDSQGPPAELAQILINAVKLTEPWYQEQMKDEKEEAKKWWQLWK